MAFNIRKNGRLRFDDFNLYGVDERFAVDTQMRTGTMHINYKSTMY